MLVVRGVDVGIDNGACGAGAGRDLAEWLLARMGLGRFHRAFLPDLGSMFLLVAVGESARQKLHSHEEDAFGLASAIAPGTIGRSGVHTTGA